MEKDRKKKIKILAAADIHGNIKIAKKLAEKAAKEEVDLVILAGDLTFAESSLDNLVGYFARKKQKVLLIPGNHESFATADFLAELYFPYAKNIHGYAFKYKGIGIFGAGGTTNIGPAMPISEKEMFETLKKGNEKLKNVRKKIMVTHIHPSNTKIEKFSKFVMPSKAVEKAIKIFKPDIAICSHVHEAEGIEEKIGKTRVIAVGKKGKVIEI